MFHYDISLIRKRTPIRAEHTFADWSCVRIKSNVSPDRKWFKLPSVFLLITLRRFLGFFFVLASVVLYVAFVFVIVCSFLLLFACLREAVLRDVCYYLGIFTNMYALKY